MIIRTISYGLLLLLMLTLLYTLLFKSNSQPTEIWEQPISTANKNSALHSQYNLQTNKAFQKQLKAEALQIGVVSPQQYAKISFRSTVRIHESTKTLHNNDMFSASVPAIHYRSIIKNNESTASTTQTMVIALSKTAIQPAYAHFSERKPFDNEQASINSGPQRAPFELDPAFPSDPGDMPLGHGHWVLVILGAIYALYKYILNLKK